MSQMVRKQIYIQKSQEERLKKVAETRGVSEAEIIRQALEIELRSMSVYRPAYDQDTWKKVVAFWEELDQRGPVGPRPRNWKRDDLYEERMKRYDRDSD
jgi:predicted DNA-binding protein